MNGRSGEMKKITILLLMLSFLIAGAVFAEEPMKEMPPQPSVQSAPPPPKVDTGDTA
jgi:hypothetical protein